MKPRTVLQMHLDRVKEHLPQKPKDFKPGEDASDIVILHLGQAIQMVMDVALRLCSRLYLGSPPNHQEAFHKLSSDGFIEKSLAKRLSDAAKLRHEMVHFYEKLDKKSFYKLAKNGRSDFEAFLSLSETL